LSWVAPLAVAVALVALDPPLAEMGRAVIVLTVGGGPGRDGFRADRLTDQPRPGRPARSRRRQAAHRTGDGRPFARFGAVHFPSGLTAGELPALPLERVLILMLLHTATAVVCIVLLTKLTRSPEQSRDTGG
jgi:hypothetical protein